MSVPQSPNQGRTRHAGTGIILQAQREGRKSVPVLNHFKMIQNLNLCVCVCVGGGWGGCRNQLQSTCQDLQKLAITIEFNCYSKLLRAFTLHHIQTGIALKRQKQLLQTSSFACVVRSAEDVQGCRVAHTGQQLGEVGFR